MSRNNSRRTNVDNPQDGEVVTITKQIRKSKIKEKNPYPQLIRQYLRQEIDFVPELAELQYRIQVQRIKAGGQRVMVKGRTFEDLENIGDHLGELYGTSSWKLFVHASKNGEKVAFETFDPFAIEWEGEEGPLEPDLEDPQVTNSNAIALQLQLQREKQDHEKALKEMEYRNAREIELIKSAKGGGMNPTQWLNILRTGVAMGGGASIDPDGSGEEDSLGAIVKPLIESIGKGIGEAISNRLVPHTPDPDPGTPIGETPSP